MLTWAKVKWFEDTFNAVHDIFRALIKNKVTVEQYGVHPVMKTSFHMCLCKCTASFEATTYQYLVINSFLNKDNGGSGITERKALAKKSIAFILFMLANSGAATLFSVSHMMEQQGGQNVVICNRG